MKPIIYSVMAILKLAWMSGLKPPGVSACDPLVRHESDICNFLFSNI